MMEDSVIKSLTRPSTTLDVNLDEENQRVDTNTTGILYVDNEYKNNRNIDHPADICENANNNVEIICKVEADALPNNKIDCYSCSGDIQEQFDDKNKQQVVADLKDLNGVLNVKIEQKTMTKPSRSRATSKKEMNKISSDQKTIVKSTPVRNTSRKVLAEKQLRSNPTYNKPTISLRSSRKKCADSQNLLYPKEPIPNEIGLLETIKKETNCNNDTTIMNDDSCSSVKENISEELPQKSNPLDVGKEEQDSEKMKSKITIPYEGLSFMEKILIREREMVQNMCKQNESTNETNNNKVLYKEQKGLDNVNTTDSMKKVIVPSKRYHRRKCSEPFKNERIQTRQSHSILVMKNQNEFSYVSEVPKTVECTSIKTEEKLENEISTEECTIICTPDININMDDKVQESFSSQDQNLTTDAVDNKNNHDLEQNVLNFMKTSSADGIPLHNNDKSKSTLLSFSNVLSNQSGCSESQTKNQLIRKRELENAEKPLRRTLRHINVQAMPVYISRISVTKTENNNKSLTSESQPPLQTRSQSDKSIGTDCDKAETTEANPVVNEQNMQQFLNGVSLRRITDKNTTPKYSYLSTTDSEETMSNVESVPNSPVQDIWPKVTGKCLKLNNVSLKPISGQSILLRRDAKLVTHSHPTQINNISITQNNDKVELKSDRKRKYSQISSNFNCSTKNTESGPQYYVEASTNRNSVSNDDLEVQQDTPWLRHYERPQKTHVDVVKNTAELENNRKEHSWQQNPNLYHQQKTNSKTTNITSINTGITDNTISDNLHVGKKHKSKNKSGKLSQPVDNASIKRRGRPRKQEARNTETNSEGNKRSRVASNGSGLTKSELERLFFKFLQHGHFRVAPGQPPIVIHNTDLYQNFSTRMQCYDPRNYYMHPHNMDTRNDSEGMTYPHAQPHLSTENNNNRFCPSNNSNSGEFADRLRTMNSNPHDSSNKYMNQTTYSRNLSPCSTDTNSFSYTNSEKAAMNAGSYNAIAQNSVSNYMQPGYNTGLNCYQNSYNNDTNAMGIDSLSNSYSGFVNLNSSTNGMNAGIAATNLSSSTNNVNDGLNFIKNTQYQHQNSIPCRQVDLPMNNGNNSIDSIQNSSTSNVNPDWNLTNITQHRDSVNESIMDSNLIHDTNKSNIPIDGNSNLNNFMNNSHYTENVSHPWMDRANNIPNHRFPVLPQWHTSLPMYNPYLNNSNRYYNNMFNPYTEIAGLDSANYTQTNMNSRNAMGMNNENLWMQNIHPSNDMQSTFNTSNQGINLSLSSNTLHSQTNSTILNEPNLGMRQNNGLNFNTEQLKENTFGQIETDNNIALQQSARGYGDHMSLPYSLGYKTDTEDLDFNDMEIGNIDDHNINDQEQQDLSQIEDFINQPSDSIECCVEQNYSHTGSPNPEIIAERPNNRETEMSKLRQELVAFTKHYSEDQTSSTSPIPQVREIFI